MRCLALLLLACVFVTAVSANDWSQFRGPAGNGVIAKFSYPDAWDKEKNMAWTYDLPGSGWAAPCVRGNKIFLTTSVGAKGTKVVGFDAGVKDPRSMPFGPTSKAPDEEYTWQLHCVDLASGKGLWKSDVITRKPAIPCHPSNTFATETPCADAERVYCWFGAVGVAAAYDHQGKQLWTKELGTGKMTAGFGTGSSPVTYDGKVFIQRDTEEKSLLVALDAATGKEIWRVDRASKSGWSTPHLWRTKDRVDLVACGSGKVIGYNPADGKEVWSLGKMRTSFTSSPSGNDEILIFGNSSPFTTGAVYAVKAGAKGDITPKNDETSSDGLAWMQSGTAPGMGSAVVVGERMYFVNGQILHCRNAKTGEKVYQQRLPGIKTVASSMWADEKRVCVLDESGQTYVIKTGDTFELLGRNKVDGLFWATPSVAEDALLLRSADKLFCVREKK